MPKFTVALSDGRALDVHAPTEADAMKHAAHAETERVVIARAHGEQVAPVATATAATKIKD